MASILLGLALRNRLVDEGYRLDMKEKMCRVALDFEKEESVKKSYELPDEQAVTLGKESFGTPAALFQPYFLGLSITGPHEMVYNSIRKSDSDRHQSFYSKVAPPDGNIMRANDEVTGAYSA